MWIEQTWSIQVTDTVYFKHQYITRPTYTKADAIVSKELIRVLQHDAPANIGQTKKQKLTELANIFNKVAITLPNQEANISSSCIQLRVDIMQQ